MSLIRSIETRPEYKLSRLAPADPLAAELAPRQSAPAEWPVAWARAREGRSVPYPEGTHPSLATAARILRSDWIVECPFCAGAQPAAITDPRFCCITEICLGGGLAGAALALEPELRTSAIQVLYPEPVLWMQVEALLLLRTEPRQRNWSPQETAADLLAESAAHRERLDLLPKVLEQSRIRWTGLFGAEAVDSFLSLPLERWAPAEASP